MNIREQHIEINQSLQKVAANRTRKFLDAEIDWVLNKMLSRFIQLKLRPRKGGKFSFDQLDLDAIRPLLVKTTLPAYIDPDFPSRYKTFLPTDYSYLIADYSYLYNTCNAEALEAINSPVYLRWLRLSYTNKSAAPFYETAILTADGTNILNIPAGLPYEKVYSGYSSKADIAFLSPWMIHTLNQRMQPGVQVGFEKYGEEYKADNIVFASDYSIVAPSLAFDGINVTLLEEQILELKRYNSDAVITPTANRLESSEDVPTLLTTAFYKSSIQSPISELQGQLLYIYGDPSFTVIKCGINYIRKPRPMSLTLGSDCELAPPFCQTLCDMAVQYIKGRLENGAGEQLIEKDLETRVIL